MSQSDDALIRRAATLRDQHAFGVLVRRYQSQLRHSLRQLTGWNEPLADDIAQETFIKAWESIASFRAESKFSTWLYRIAYNQLISNSRKSSNREIPTEELEDSATEAPKSSDLHRDLANAMRGLNEGQRMALHLYLHRECSQQEISDIMEIPLGTVKTHIIRGREKLQKILADWRTEVVYD